MCPQTRNSAKKAGNKAPVKKDNHPAKKCQIKKKNSFTIAKRKVQSEEQKECFVDIPIANAEESGTDTVSSASSSSAEDSDDDYELEIGNRRKVRTEDTQESEDNNEVLDIEAIERKIDQDLRKKRLKQKRINTFADDDDDDLICDYESTSVKKNRKRRLFRRRMLREPGGSKRRRIKRASKDVTTQYTCDSFAQFGYTSLTTEVQKDDVDVDVKALNTIFGQLRLKTIDSTHLSSDDDETNFVVDHLNTFHNRNAEERRKQVIHMEVNPFSEKLSGYGGSKTLQGSTTSHVHNYHPQMFESGELYKLPHALVWDRPFKHLFYHDSTFDIHKETKDFLNKVANDKKSEKVNELLDEVKKSVINRMLEAAETKAKVKKFKLERTSPDASYSTPSDYQQELSHVGFYNRQMVSIKKEKKEVPEDVNKAEEVKDDGDEEEDEDEGVKNGEEEMEDEILKNGEEEMEDEILKNGEEEMEDEILKNGEEEMEDEILKNDDTIIFDYNDEYS